MTFAQSMLSISLITPFVVAGLSALTYKHKQIRDFINLTGPFITLLAASALIFGEPQWLNTTLDLNFSVAGIPIAFSLEPLGVIFAALVCLLWPTAMLYTTVYLVKSENQSKFLVYYNLSVGSALCIAVASNFLTLFIFYEILTLCTYPLITHTKTKEALSVGRFYLASLLGTSMMFLLVAVIWIWSLTGTLNFVEGGILRDANVTPAVVSILFILTVAGCAKAALMPLHQWLPKAMVAPVPVSALLHAVAVVKAGVFTIAKAAVYIFGIDVLRDSGTEWLIFLACATIIIASIIALRQSNLKRLLAYSTVSQLSYIILGIALLSPMAIVASALHMLGHGFGKITLFFVAGAIQVNSGKTQTDQMAGIGRQMPWTMTAFTVSALSIIGLPPFLGFTSKWFLLTEASATNRYFVVAVIIISTILNAMYFLPIIYRAFFVAGDKVSVQYKEAPMGMLVSILWPASLCIVLFFWVDNILKFLVNHL